MIKIKSLNNGEFLHVIIHLICHLGFPHVLVVANTAVNIHKYSSMGRWMQILFKVMTSYNWDIRSGVSELCDNTIFMFWGISRNVLLIYIHINTSQFLCSLNCAKTYCFYSFWYIILISVKWHDIVVLIGISLTLIYVEDIFIPVTHLYAFFEGAHSFISCIVCILVFELCEFFLTISLLGLLCENFFYHFTDDYKNIVTYFQWNTIPPFKWLSINFGYTIVGLEFTFIIKVSIRL